MRFKRIYIEIINTCNLRCDFCIQNHRTPCVMRIDEFKHIIKEIQPYCEYVYLHVMGEPLSHPDLEAILTICAKAQIQVNITTNGTLLKKQEDILLRSKLRQVNISLHSFPQHYMSNYLDEVMETAEKLAGQAIHVNYRLWSLQDTKLTTETALILKKIQERYHIEITQDQQKRLQRIDLQNFLHLHFEEIFKWPSLEAPFISHTGRCLGMKTMCGILSNGDVVPCCLDSKGDVFLGNIFQQSFQGIVESKRVKKMVEGFQQHQLVEDLCQHCGYRTRFL